MMPLRLARAASDASWFWPWPWPCTVKRSKVSSDGSLQTCWHRDRISASFMCHTILVRCLFCVVNCFLFLNYSVIAVGEIRHDFCSFAADRKIESAHTHGRLYLWHYIGWCVCWNRRSLSTIGVKMAISNAAQFALLLWKNWLLQKRRIVLTTFQILIPTLIALMLLIIRILVKSKLHRLPTIWNEFDPSVDPADFMTLSSPPPNQTNQTDSFQTSTSPPDDETRTAPRLVLAFSPNTSLAATRMADNIYQMLNVTPNGIGCLLSLYRKEVGSASDSVSNHFLRQYCPSQNDQMQSQHTFCLSLRSVVVIRFIVAHRRTPWCYSLSFTRLLLFLSTREDTCRCCHHRQSTKVTRRTALGRQRRHLSTRWISPAVICCYLNGSWQDGSEHLSDA